jgi:hypothetical protein
VDVGAPACSLATAGALGQSLLDEVRANVRARAERAVEQYGGGRLGKLASAVIGSVDVGTSCATFGLTATATATYDLE